VTPSETPVVTQTPAPQPTTTPPPASTPVTDTPDEPSQPIRPLGNADVPAPEVSSLPKTGAGSDATVEAAQHTALMSLALAAVGMLALAVGMFVRRREDATSGTMPRSRRR